MCLLHSRDDDRPTDDGDSSLAQDTEYRQAFRRVDVIDHFQQ